VKANRALLALAISAAVLGTAGYAIGQSRAAADNAAKNESADEFIARVNRTIKELTPEITSASWLAATYINEDSQRIESAANERFLTLNNEFIEQAKTYDTAGLSPATARALHLLKTSSSLPAP
jgi:peptidyl-dipeptidase A